MTAGDKPEEGGDDVKSSCPYDLGYTRATMDNTKGSETARSSKSHKVVLSSDCSLQLDYMKLESLVIVDQHATVNTFPGLVHTARHTTRVCNTRSRWSNHLELAVEGGTNDWGEVVTVAVSEGAAGSLLSKDIFGTSRRDEE